MKKWNIACTPDFEEKLEAILAEPPKEHTEIHFEAGSFYFARGIRLNEEHRDITFTGEPGTRLIGGKCLKHWEPAAELPDAARLSPEARAHVLVCDLGKEGIPASRGFASRGYARYSTPSHSELFGNTVPFQMSQYPKGSDFTHITGLPSSAADEWNEEVGALENGFYCNDPHLKEWKSDSTIEVLGYWKYDWANTVEQLDTLDPETGKIQMKAPGGQYAYRVGQRIRFYHILEEVTAPGDYYIDLEKNLAYIYPRTEGEEILISLNDEPFFYLDHSEKITFRGLCMEATCGHAITAEFTEKLHIDNCLFRNIGNYAVNIMEGHDPTVENCTIHDCGDGGIVVFGGNRCTLEPERATIYNNHIYRIAKWSKCYQPAIHLIGVGMSACHNLIHDCPHTAILFNGNEMTVSDNEIYRVVLETGDAGAIYIGRDYTFRGNVVSHNYIHHLGGVGFGTMGIYNDDAVSGTKMCDNYLEELTRGIMLGGGRDFIVRNNVFVKCDPAINFDSRGADDHPVWSKMHFNSMRPRFYRIERYPHVDCTTRRNREQIEKHRGEWVSAMDSEYIRRYPELARLDEFYRNQHHDRICIPGQALVEHNVFISKLQFRYSYDESTKTIYDNGREVPNTRMLRAYITDFSRHINRTISGSMGDLRLNSNYIAEPSDFVDAKWSNLSVKPDSMARHYGYMDGDFETIGLVEANRFSNPAKVRTCVELNADRTVIRVGLRNQKNEPVHGTMFLSASGKMEPAVRSMEFSLEGGKEKFLEIPLLHDDEEGTIEAYFDVPGVRPSRS